MKPIGTQVLPLLPELPGSLGGTWHAVSGVCASDIVPFGWLKCYNMQHAPHSSRAAVVLRVHDGLQSQLLHSAALTSLSKN